eukprot:100810_1
MFYNKEPPPKRGRDVLEQATSLLRSGDRSKSQRRNIRSDSDLSLLLGSSSNESSPRRLKENKEKGEIPQVYIPSTAQSPSPIQSDSSDISIELSLSDNSEVISIASSKQSEMASEILSFHESETEKSISIPEIPETDAEEDAFTVS